MNPTKIVSAITLITMTLSANKLWIFDEITEELSQRIKYFHVFSDYSDERNVFIVTTDDKVFAFGQNRYGYLGFGHSRRVDVPQEVRGLSAKKIIEFFIGCGFVLALSADNRLYSWGKNDFGQLGRGFVSDSHRCFGPKEMAFFADRPAIKQVCCSGENAMVLLEDGSVYAWGSNERDYQSHLLFEDEELPPLKFLGQQYGDTVPEPKPLEFSDHNQVKYIYLYSSDSYELPRDFYFEITTDNKVYSWGYNRDQCLGHPIDDIILTPRLVRTLSDVDVVDVKCHYDHPDGFNSNSYIATYFLTGDGSIFYCGYSEEKGQTEPVPIEIEEKFTMIEHVQSTSMENVERILAMSER